MELSTTDICQMRLSSHRLDAADQMSARELVTWFAAVQGQEYAQSKWGLGLRLPHPSDVEMETLLSESELVRTHLLRPTWHLVTADDIYWLLALTAPRVHQANAFMYSKLELTPALFNRCNAIVERILENAQLTREEINEEFKKTGIEVEGHRLSYIMMNAELNGIVCSGARRGNQFTYALLSERVPNKQVLTQEEALSELTQRYFQSRGPATAADFATWSGLTLIQCKQGIISLAPRLEKAFYHGNEYYFFSPTSSIQMLSTKMHLLPIYDEYILGYKDRNAILEFKNEVTPGSPFRYDCMMIQSGQIIGTWKRTIKKKAIELSCDFFQPLTQLQTQEFDNALEKLSMYYQLPVMLNE